MPAQDSAGSVASALELADDLRRYLDGQPIRRRRVGVAERAGKWVRRHPTTTALAIVTIVAAIASAFALTLRGALDEAETGYHKARQVVDDVCRFGERHLRDNPIPPPGVARIFIPGAHRLPPAAVQGPEVRGRVRGGPDSSMAQMLDLIGSDVEALGATRAYPCPDVRRGPPRPDQAQSRLAETLHQIGLHHEAIGNREAAIQHLSEAMAIRQRFAEATARSGNPGQPGGAATAGSAIGTARVATTTGQDRSTTRPGRSVSGSSDPTGRTSGPS